MAKAAKKAGRRTAVKARKTSARKSSARKSAQRANGKRTARRWSARVTLESAALTLEPNVFTKRTPGEIARSLKRSADSSRRRKSGSFQSAMSMLNFYINRAGRNLPAAKKKRLEQAKDALRELYGRA